METWTTVLVAFVVACSTLGATFLQNWHSSKRFGRELQRAQEGDNAKRNWEVRSEPLLKLRHELTVYVTKLDKAVRSAHRLHTRLYMTEEQAKKELQANIDELNSYLASGSFIQTQFMQFDKGLIDKVEEIIKEYRSSYFIGIDYKEVKATELGKAMDVLESNKAKIIEVQELINKRLEEL